MDERLNSFNWSAFKGGNRFRHSVGERSKVSVTQRRSRACFGRRVQDLLASAEIFLLSKYAEVVSSLRRSCTEVQQTQPKLDPYSRLALWSFAWAPRPFQSTRFKEYRRGSAALPCTMKCSNSNLAHDFPLLLLNLCDLSICIFTSNDLFIEFQVVNFKEGKPSRPICLSASQVDGMEGAERTTGPLPRLQAHEEQRP